MTVDVLTLARMLPLAPERYWHGDLTLAARPAAAVLNSRQGRHPHGGEAWVQATLRAAADLIRDEKVLLGSTGMTTWELATWAAAEALGDTVLLAPLTGGTIPEDAPLLLQQVLDDFGLSKQNALILPFFVPPRENVKTLWKARDGLILRNAERLCPVSIREGGFLDSCLADPRMTGRIDPRFRVACAPEAAGETPVPEAAIVECKLSGRDWSDWIIHWTRAADGPWPGETRSDYYRDLVASRDAFARSAEKTLLRMLREQKIRATGWRMPLNMPMVSLSAAPPWEMVARMSWRGRYVRMSFEPWGIAVRRAALLRLGAREVIYGGLEIRRRLSATERLYFQQAGGEAGWEKEREWRLRSDLDLNVLADDEALLLVPDKAARSRLRPDVRFEVISLT